MAEGRFFFSNDCQRVCDIFWTNFCGGHVVQVELRCRMNLGLAGVFILVVILRSRAASRLSVLSALTESVAQSQADLYRC